MSSSITVDRPARDKLAEQLRHYATGSISNFTLDDKLPVSDDPALDEIFTQGVWPLYDDLHEYKRVGPDRLNPDQRKHLARVILFLKSDLPYRWPSTHGLRFLPIRFLSIVTFGSLGRVWLNKHWQTGDQSVWPFISSQEFEAAKKVFPYHPASA